MKKRTINFDDPNFKPRTLVELLRWRAATEPNKKAYTYLKDGDRKEIYLTYGELDKKAQSIALMLQQKGLVGQRALLLYPPGLDYIAGFFGCLYAGVIAVPAYPPDPNRLNRSLPRLQAIVNDAGATVALTTDSILYMIRMLRLGSKLTNSLDKIPFMRKFQTSMKYFSSGKRAVAESRELGDLQWLSTDSSAQILTDQWVEPNITPETISFLQYTSGSTGNPKGVILTHDNLLANSEVIYSGLGSIPNMVDVFWLPIYHDMGLIGGVLQPLYSGNPSVFMSPIAFLQRPLRWLDAISRIPEEFVVGSAAPNFAYDLCVKKATPEKLKNLDLSRWVFALSGAEPVRAQTIDRFSETFKDAGFRKSSFYPAYGLAEATLLVTGSQFETEPVTATVDRVALKKNKIIEVPKEDPSSITMVSSGRGQNPQITLIVDPDSFQECKPGEIGEIWVKGDSVSKGYYSREEATKETFQNYLADSGDGPFLRTGDLGFVKGEDFFVVGRVKDLIIIRGTNHYPQDIELTIEQAHPELRPGCSAAFTIDENDTEELILICEVRHNKNQNFNAIIQSIRQAVTENHDLQASTIILIKARSIHKTSSGKIMRRATKADFLENKLSVVEKWESAAAREPQSVQDYVDVSEKAAPSVQKTEIDGTKTDDTRLIEDWLVAQLADILGMPAEEIDIRQPFISFGMDSAQAVGLAGDLEEFLDRTLPPTLIWDYPSIESLARYLSEEESISISGTKTVTKRQSDYEPIAIIGLGSRFPGASNSNEFWNLLTNNIDGISEVPADRWDPDQHYNPDPAVPGKMITKEGGFLEHVDLFDADFFGISPREAVHIDPQQRLMLEVSWEALEHAGKTMNTVSGSRTGVFVGISSNDYSRIQNMAFEKINPWAGTGNAFSIAANRLSYFYDFRGPSLAIDTACSSSLVSVHTACQSLRDGDCDMALAGGVNLILSPEVTITFSQARMMAANGRCKTFDASADGYGRGEGAGIVVMKRLSEAQRDKDNILAVINGSAINQDGRSNGITAPNSLAQQAVIREALDNADLAPDQIQYIETHGTGTPLGDPIEIQSLKKVMMQERSKANPLFIGSVKTNIAHLESAAGIASLIKVVLSLQHEQIPAHLHFNEWNPHIQLDEVPMQIVTENKAWTRSDKKRYAGVSAFGFGGTNAHLILEEAPLKPVVSEVETSSDDSIILPFSAQNESGLKELLLHYKNYLSRNGSKLGLHQLGYNLAHRRSHFDHRLGIIASDMNQLKDQINEYINDGQTDSMVYGKRDPNFRPKIAFVFSGQGPQWWGMGRELFEQEPIFRATIERISFLFEEYSGWSLKDELDKSEADNRLDQTEVAQPALFAIQVALSAYWRKLGIVPDTVIGHSIGEVAAAHISGILSLESAIKVVYHRSRLMQQATGLGKMAAIDLPIDTLQPFVEDFQDQVSLGARNSHTSNVICGNEQALDQILDRLTSEDVFFKKLPVNYAFHSPQMEPFRKELSAVLEGLELQKMNIPIVSTVSGKIAKEDDYAAEYWGRNIRESVQFSKGIDLLIEQNHTVFIELGPHPVLKNYITQNLEALSKEAHILPSIRRKEAEQKRVLLSLTQLFTIGYPINWSKLYPEFAPFVNLPTYPFQRERYWIEEESETIAPTKGTTKEHPLLGREHSSALMPTHSNWTVQLKYDFVAYLNNGRDAFAPVLPESAYLEMAFAASAQTYHTEEIVLKNIVFKNILSLRKSESKQLHFSLTPVSAKKAYFQAYSKPAQKTNSQSWLIHSLGSILTDGASENVPSSPIDLKAIRKRLKPVQSITALLSDGNSSLIDMDQISRYGQNIWAADNEILMRIKIDDLDQLQADHYRVHPRIIDNLFQLIFLAAQVGEQQPFIYRPHSLGTFKLSAQPVKDFWAHITISRTDAQKPVILSQLHVSDLEGRQIFEVKDLRLEALSISEAMKNLFYDVEWQKLSLQKHSRRTAELSDQWILLSDESERAHSLFQKLIQKNKSCIRATFGSTNSDTSENLVQLNPSDNEFFLAKLKKIVQPASTLIYFWNLNQNSMNPEYLHTFISSIDQLDAVPGEIWLLTQSAINSDGSDYEINPNQAALWDVQRALVQKYSNLNIRLLNMGEQNSNIFNAIHIDPRETEINMENNVYSVPRLIKFRQMSSTNESEQPLPFTSDLRYDPLPSEVEIKVLAQAIDLPKITQLNDDSKSGMFEYSGVVEKVGTEITEFKKGDEVIAYAGGGLQHYAICDARLLKQKPKSISFTEAAALPVPYLSVHYALTYLARVQKEENVLILDANTPFGQAAIQTARHFNCRIFATVQSHNQKKALESAGVRDVYVGHSLNLIDDITEQTSGSGVDIIVNTAGDNQLTGIFSILKDFGRFLELSLDGSFDQPLVYHHLRRNVSFFAVDMDQVAAQQTHLVGTIFDEVIELAESGIYRVSNINTLSYQQVSENPSIHTQFPKHNRQVLTYSDIQAQPQKKPALFDSDKTYFVAGLFDKNDLSLLEWMSLNGAEKIYAFNLRNTEVNLKGLKSNSADIKFISDFSQISTSEINGVYLSLNEIPIELDSNQVKANLLQIAEALKEASLDYCISLSQFDLGIKGLDPVTGLRFDHLILALLQKRLNKNLPALHVQIGGVIPKDRKNMLMRWDTISNLIKNINGRIIINETDWNKLFAKHSPESIPAFYDYFLPKTRRKADKPESQYYELSRADLLAENQDKREIMLQGYLTAEIARVLKMAVDKIKIDQPLTSLGIDSLMAIELKNTVESKLDVNLPIASLLQGPSIKDLSAEFLPQFETETKSKRVKPLRPKPTNVIRESKLSSGQKAMFFQHMMNPDSIFNLAYAVRIRSSFESTDLQNSFQALVDRHPSLRTTFHLLDGQPLQRIHPDMPAFFYEERISDWTDSQLKQRLEEEVLSHFDLENGPLMRVFLFERSSEDSILLFVMHHIVTDIWSQALLLNEISQIFAARGDTSALPTQFEDYTDYISWQDDLLQGKSGAKLFKYWQEKLAGELPVLNIPIDKPRPSVQTYKGKTETLWFPEELSNKTHRFAEEHGTTVFTLLLTVYYMLLNRYTGQEDIIVGSPTAGRSKKEFAAVIGYFVNPVPFRADLSGNPIFLNFLEQVKTNVLQAFEHMDYPLTEMVEKVHPQRDPSRTPLFQTMFILQRAHLMHDQGLSEFALSREGATLNLGGLTIESMALEQGVAPFDLTMMAVESGSGLAASLGYNIDLFEADTIQRILQHYLMILEAVVSNPNLPISQVYMLPEQEFNQITQNWNQTEDALTGPDCVHTIFEKQAQEYPGKTALHFEEDKISYAILNQKANQLAHHLISQNVGSGSFVGICVERSMDMVIAILAVLKTGAAYIPIDPSYPQERISYMLLDADINIILSQKHLLSKVTGTQAQTILLGADSDKLVKYSTENPNHEVDPKELAYIIYTSGSTGKPKGTMLHHRGLVNALHSTRKNYFVEARSKVLQFASFSFDASVEEIFSTLTAGATLHLVRKETLLSLAELINLINREQITNMTLPPSVLSVLQPSDFPSVKTVISAGEKCPTAVVARWSEDRNFINGYGPTETTICATTYQAESTFGLHVVPIGKPIHNVRTYVLDQYLNPVPIGVPGELFIGGAGVARGYFNRPELTAERFIPDRFSTEAGERLYRTGDLVRYLPDGNLEFIERIDQQIKIRGFRIELGEIESVIKDLPLIKDVTVVAKLSGTENRILAYIILDNAAKFDENEMKLNLKNKLPDYMVPTALIPLDEFPLTTNGKIDRKALPDPEQGQTGQTFVKPGSDLERKLASIWQEVLQVDQIGVNDSFFDLGGHSLGIVQVQGKIKEVFERDLNVVDMFKYPTIASLAKFLSDKGSSKETIRKSQDRASRQREATRTQQRRQPRRNRNRKD